MGGQSELTPTGELVLARLLVGGDKGATGAEFKKALEPLLGHRWAGASLTDQIERTLDGLAEAGLVARVRKGRSRHDFLTPAGSRRILELLGLEQLPPKTNWDKLKKTYLTARALGLPSPKAEAAKRIGTDDGFKAAILKLHFALSLDDYPAFKEALDALAWTLMGLPPGRPFNVQTVQAALIRRALADPRDADPKANPRKEVTRLLARKVGARQSGKDELRLATLRQWIDREQPIAEAEPVAPAPAPAGLDLPTFARRVIEAARSSPSGRFGDNKVFVIHVWRGLQADPAFEAPGLDSFKRRLAEANNARLLDLSRADLVEAMDPEDVRLSEVPYLGTTFHFVRLPS